MAWFEEYIGKPWHEKCDPPKSFNCGELIRYIYKDRLSIDLPPITANPAKLKECIANLDIPDVYGMETFEGDPRPFDICYIMRKARRDHVGMAVQTIEGLQILHCQQFAGVILQSASEIMGTTGCRFIEWRRHKNITESMALCHA